MLLPLLIALALWTLMFSPWMPPIAPFWGEMTVSALLLSSLATWKRPRWWREEAWTWRMLPTGLAIAAALWGVFWVGDKASAWLFDFARPQVDLIYGLKTGMSPWVLSLLLLLLIGPAEEIFWRGYVQRTLSARWGQNAGWAVATMAYTLVHVPSLNFMLVAAAAVCGAAWGTLFRFFPRQFPAIIVSHALWDAAVFVWLPI